MRTFIKAFVLCLLLVPFASIAGQITNMDKVDHEIVITHLGDQKELVKLRPNETHRFYGPWLELGLKGGPSITTDRNYEFVIQDGQIVLMRIIDNKAAGIF